jgi:glycosyltransferase involved in cell wall biosynthesis
VLPTTLGRAMYRINAGLKKYAPEWVHFINDPESADVQIQDCIGAGSLPFIRNKNHILLQECLMTEIAPPDWLPYFKEAKLVVSYLNIPKIIGSSDFNFLRNPCGVDPEIWFKIPEATKHITFMTTGYVAETESIKEIYSAVNKVGGRVAHVGKDFKYGINFHHSENLSDEAMRYLYNSSYYISGLRRAEGFELSVLEGLLCGARGVSFNAEHYSYWFEDLVEYIEEKDSQSVTEQIQDLLINKLYRPVSDSEISFVKNKFSWETVSRNFWSGVKNAI